MQTPEQEPEKKSPAKPQRILMVNEQRSFQVMMKAMLINLGISNITYSNTAEDARRRCQKGSFDIYLIDYDLGVGENGRQLLESLRDKDSDPAPERGDHGEWRQLPRHGAERAGSRTR